MFPVAFDGLRFRLLLLVLVAVVPALGLTLYSAREDYEREAADVQAHVLRLAEQAVLEDQEFVEGARQLLVALAELPPVRAGDVADCRALFASLLKQYRRYDNFGVIAPNGEVLCSAAPLPGPVYAEDRPYFQRAVETRAFAIGDFQIGRIVQRPEINFGYPVLDDQKRVLAVVYAALDLGWLQSVVSTIRAQVPQDSLFLKIDARGTVLARHPESEIELGQPLSDATLVKAVLSQHLGLLELTGSDRRRRVYAFAPLRSPLHQGRIYAILGIPRQAVYGEVDRALVRNMFWLAIVAGTVVIVAWVGSDLLVLRRVRTLVESTRRLAAGDLTARTGVVTGSCELDLLARAFDQMAASLQERNAASQLAEHALRAGQQEMQVLSRRLLEAQEAERRQVARELHDEIGQLLTSLKLALEMSRRLCHDEARHHLLEAEKTADDLITRVRELSLDLRPGMLDDLGLLPALVWHCDRFRGRTGVRVILKHSGIEGRRFGAAVETAAYRITQEALTNVARHAGVGDATVRIWADARALGVQIEDRGAGFSPDIVLTTAGTAGLPGMRERATLLGGSLTVDSTPGGGTRITAELPLPELPQDADANDDDRAGR